MKPVHFNFRTVLVLSLFLWITKTEGQNNRITRNSASDTLGSSYFFYQQPQYPSDCYEALNQCSSTNSSGVYVIKPDGYPAAFEVYCDNSMNGGGWTVIYRRNEGAISFHRSWKEYKNGFGFLSSEFWFGLDRLSFLTNQKKYELRIEMENATGSSFYIQYNKFRISDEWGDFKISNLGKYSRTSDNFIKYCPANMEYGNCICQATCEDPDNFMGCYTTCSSKEACVCREGFVKSGDDCVRPEECSCYMEGVGIISNGETRVNFNCTSRCQCQSDVLTCDDNYQCNSNAICEERDGERQCYCNDGYAGDGQICVEATDCADIYSAGVRDNGVYPIKPRSWPGSPFDVYCSMSDGGWTIFQRRVDGSQDFYLGWSMYKNGFGSPNHELWLGNEKIYYMTNDKTYQLRIDLTDMNGSQHYAQYSEFRISDENDKYRMVGLGTVSGNAGHHSFYYHKNDPFSTYDRDNDDTSTYNCAERHRGGWWYDFDYIRSPSVCRPTGEAYCDFWFEDSGCGYCALANLNGDYNSTIRGTSIHWASFSGYNCNIAHTEMKIKPV